MNPDQWSVAFLHEDRPCSPASACSIPHRGWISVAICWCATGVIADFGPGLGRPDGGDGDRGRRTPCCARGWSICAPPSASPATNTARPSPPPPSAAAAGGITTLAALPETAPAIDDPALVHLLRARGEETGSLTILPYGAVTTGCKRQGTCRTWPAARSRRDRFHRWQPGHRLGAADAPCACPTPAASAPASCSIRRTRRLPPAAAATEGELATRLGLPGIPAAAEAILVARDIRLARADRRGGAFRPCLDRRGAGPDPPGEGGRRGRDLRYRAALFRPERDGDRRVPHLRQAVAAAAQGSRPAGGGCRAGRWHDRRHRVRPPAARCRRQAPAVRPGGGRAAPDWPRCWASPWRRCTMAR